MGSYLKSGYSLGSNTPTLDFYIEGSSGKSLKQRTDDFYQCNYPSNAVYWQQGMIDKRFKAGDQSLNSMIYGDSQWFRSKKWYINLIRRITNMICGYERRNRKSTVVLPIHDRDDPLADDYNGTIKWSENRDGFYETISQAFENAVDTGLSLLYMYPNYTFDPISGDLFTDNVGFNNFLIDSNWRKMDFSDCQGIWRRRWVDRLGAKVLLPGMTDKIDHIRPVGSKDGRFPYQAELQNINKTNMFSYDEFLYRDTRLATMLIDPKSGESMEWEDENDPNSEQMLQQILQMQPWLVKKNMYIPTVKLGILLNGEPVYDGPNLLNIDSYPCVPIVAYHEPDLQYYSWRLQGIVRGLRDVQYLYNMRKVIEMDIIQSQINSGWIYKVNRLTDPKALRQSGQGFFVPLKDTEHPIADSIQRLDAPGVAPGILELSKILAEDMNKIAGATEELFGQGNDDISGMLSVYRRGAGLTSLQGIFDKLDYSQRLYGSIRLQAIRKNFSKGKVTSILGREPDPRFFTSYSLKYSIAVEEGRFSTTQRQEELAQLVHFKQLGIPISNEDIIDAAFITNKKKVKENMRKDQEAQSKAQQQQAQMQAQLDQSKAASQFAKAQLDQQKAVETQAKIQEILATAEHKSSDADLNLVRQMIELENMDLDNFKRSIELAQVIKGANQPQPISIPQGGQNG